MNQIQHAQSLLDRLEPLWPRAMGVRRLLEEVNYENGAVKNPIPILEKYIAYYFHDTSGAIPYRYTPDAHNELSERDTEKIQSDVLLAFIS